MVSNRYGVRVEDYDSASRYINRGRNKTHRTLYHKNLYASYRNGGKSIGIHFKSWGPDLIRYVPGELAIICLTPNSSYPSTRDAISQYANLAGLMQRNHKLYLLQDDDTFTPTRKVSCPKCRGKGVHWYQCNGQKTRNRKGNGYSFGREITTFSGQKIYLFGCNCLQANPNLDPDNHRAKVNCQFCRGNGFRELGGKRKAFQWDGGPLTIDLNTGKILKVHKPTLLINVVQTEGEGDDSTNNGAGS